MPARLPGDANWVGGYTSPSDVAKRIFAERELINAKTKLTWNPEDPSRFPTDRMVGEVNLSAPYMRIGTRTPGRVYYIQNGKWFFSNGVETNLDALLVAERNDPEICDTLIKAEEIFLADASRRDDALCRVCLHYRSKNHEDYLRHAMTMHPEHVAKVAGISLKEPERPVAPKLDGWVCCGKSFADARAFGAHTRFKKTHDTGA